MEDSERTLSTILKHDTKVTSYKIALLRAINDVVLSFPDLRNFHCDVAIPLRVLGQFWVAYYWPFVDPREPIFQGQRATLDGSLRNDMAFRPQLNQLRQEWETYLGGLSRPSDGFFLINELRVSRKRDSYPQSLLTAYKDTLKQISKTLEMPIKYAGVGHWTVFAKPTAYSNLGNGIVPIPGTQTRDKCLVVKANLWNTFREMSLWIEALCLHEWCLFTERVQQDNQSLTDRGFIYRLLTDRPDNRRPLSWERNQVDLLLMEGTEFICPWTQKRITKGTRYDLDHILPVSLYPINELWNLVPADPHFNSHMKRDRLPSLPRLQQAQPHLALTYEHYRNSDSLAIALNEDVSLRFATISTQAPPSEIAIAVTDLIEIVAASRNIARFN